MQLNRLTPPAPMKQFNMKWNALVTHLITIITKMSMTNVKWGGTQHMLDAGLTNFHSLDPQWGKYWNLHIIHEIQKKTSNKSNCN